MPYYYDQLQDLNILFIHIPKTGGTSLHNYFVKKYNIKLDKYKNLYGLYFLKGPIKSSLQHLTLSHVLSLNYINIIKENLKIITIVRNPYTRLVSHILWEIKMNKKNIVVIDKNQIYKEIKKIFNNYKNNTGAYDNHIKPQYQFLINDDKINENIIILKQEDLTNMMHDIGFSDFDIHDNKADEKYTINDFLNDESINLINDFYEKDFITFGYNMVQI
jgi:hypothetical protein